MVQQLSKPYKIIFVLFWLLKFSDFSTASFEVTKFVCACRHTCMVGLKTWIIRSLPFTCFFFEDVTFNFEMICIHL